jgi:hypothetical protein
VSASGGPVPVAAAGAPPGAGLLYRADAVIEEVRATHPQLVAAAEREGPAPRLFIEFNSDTPPFCASGLPVAALESLPWQLRRPVAAAPDLATAYRLAEHADDPLKLSEIRFGRENLPYVQAVSQWLIGQGATAGSETQYRASADGDDDYTAEQLHNEIFGPVDAPKPPTVTWPGRR